MNDLNRWRPFMIAVCATTFCSAGAQAMGYCNADHSTGPIKVQGVVTAAAKFYEASAHLMKMLEAFEKSDPGSAKNEAITAAGLFHDSATDYVKTKDTFAIANWASELDKKTIFAMAGDNSGKRVNAVLQIGSDGPYALMEKCAEKAGQLGKSVNQFAAEAGDHPTTVEFSRLLNSFTETLNFGTAVSAVFASTKLEKK